MNLNLLELPSAYTLLYFSLVYEDNKVVITVIVAGKNLWDYDSYNGGMRSGKQTFREICHYNSIAIENTMREIQENITRAIKYGIDPESLHGEAS